MKERVEVKKEMDVEVGRRVGGGKSTRERLKGRIEKGREEKFLSKKGARF